MITLIGEVQKVLMIQMFCILFKPLLEFNSIILYLIIYSNFVFGHRTRYNDG